MDQQPEDAEQPLSVPVLHEEDQLLDAITSYTGDDPVLRICRDFAWWARQDT